MYQTLIELARKAFGIEWVRNFLLQMAHVATNLLVEYIQGVLRDRGVPGVGPSFA